MRLTFEEPNWELSGWDELAGAGAKIAAVPGDAKALILTTGINTYPGTWPFYGAIPLTLAIGTSYTVRARINGDDADEPTPFQVFINGVAEMFAGVAYKSQVGAGLQLVDMGSFVATESPLTLFAVLWNSRIQDPPNQTTGQWVVGDIYVLSPDDLDAEDEMSKRRAIREALVARIESVTTGNGYALTIQKVATGPVRIPDGVENTPMVAVAHGEEVKTVHTFGRKTAVVTYLLGVACKRTESVDPDDQCDDACGEIEKAIEITRDALTGATVAMLGLSYIDDVFVRAIDPEELPPEIAREMAAWTMAVDVTYHHERRNP